jgi:hypothetical protein
VEGQFCERRAQEDHPFWVYVGLTLVLQFHYGAGYASFPPSKERRPGLLLAFIHPSAWKGCSANFACRGLSITLDTYSHVLPGMGDQAAEAMDEAL